MTCIKTIFIHKKTNLARGLLIEKSNAHNIYVRPEVDLTLRNTYQAPERGLIFAISMHRQSKAQQRKMTIQIHPVKEIFLNFSVYFIFLSEGEKWTRGLHSVIINTSVILFQNSWPLGEQSFLTRVFKKRKTTRKKQKSNTTEALSAV